MELRDRAIAELERASMEAWPALEERVMGRWRLRFSGGSTKRLNSVQPLGESREPLEQKVDRCEAWYASRGRPCIFRFTPNSELAVEEVLSERGYVLTAPSLVLRTDLGEAADEADTASCDTVEPAAWLDAFGRVSGEPGSQHRFRKEVLSRIVGTRLLAVLESEPGSPVACGVGVLEGHRFGLFEVLVSEGRRREGFGTLLVRSMLGWARRRGGRLAYLQVTEANQGARRLYDSLGFSPAYPYWYRVQARHSQHQTPEVEG